MRRRMVLALSLMVAGGTLAQAQQESLLPLLLLGGSQVEQKACQRRAPAGNSDLLPLLLLGGALRPMFGGSPSGFGTALLPLLLPSEAHSSRCRRTQGARPLDPFFPTFGSGSGQLPGMNP